MTLWGDWLSRLMGDSAKQTPATCSICYQSHCVEYFDDGNLDRQTTDNPPYFKIISTFPTINTKQPAVTHLPATPRKIFGGKLLKPTFYFCNSCWDVVFWTASEDVSGFL